MPKKISGTRLSAYQAKGDATKFPDKRYHELRALGLKLYSPLPIEPLPDNTTRAVVPLAYGGTAPCGLEVSVRRHGAKLWRCRDTRGPSAKTYDLGFCCDVTATAAYKVAQEIFSQAPVTAYPEPPNQGSSGKTPEDNHSLRLTEYQTGTNRRLNELDVAVQRLQEMPAPGMELVLSAVAKVVNTRLAELASEFSERLDAIVQGFRVENAKLTARLLRLEGLAKAAKLDQSPEEIAAKLSALTDNVSIRRTKQ